MLTLFSPVTNKVYRALMKINVSSDTIEEAKNNYSYGTLCLSDGVIAMSNDSLEKCTFESYNLAYEENFVNFIRLVYEKNNDNAVLVETKINELDNVLLLRIITILDYRDKLLFLDMIKNSSKSAFVTRDVRILELLIRLATRELLFSTFHFLTCNVAICCQPNLCFPVFINEFSGFETYLELASESNLDLCNLHIKN